MRGLAAGHSTYFVKAGATIDRAILRRKEGNLRLDTALGTNNGVHLSRSTLRTTRRTHRVTARLTAGAAAARLVHQAFLLVKLLLSGSEDEIISAITALQGFVNEAQLGTSLVNEW